MRKILCTLMAISSLAFADFCESPWESIKSPNSHLKTCRLSVPHGWIVMNMAINDIESPNTFFVPDEAHEWNTSTN
jgi:hypothetical protein